MCELYLLDTFLSLSSVVLGSKLDLDIHSNSCRLAFEGKLVHHYEDKSYRTKDLPQLKIYKFKEKKGVVISHYILDQGISTGGPRSS